MEHAFSNDLFEDICFCSHKYRNWITYFFHELMQHFGACYSLESIHKYLVANITFKCFVRSWTDADVHSKYHFANIGSHKYHIWKAYFLHELIEHVFYFTLLRTFIYVVTSVAVKWFIDKECLSKLVYLLKWESQISHLKDFFFEFSILN